MKPANIFDNLAKQLAKEQIDCLLERKSVHIERIISQGHSTPEGQWYDQDSDEWVILLQGQATIVYQQDNQRIHLQPGDYLLIPAHSKHRVEWTKPNVHTVWLALHLPDHD